MTPLDPAILAESLWTARRTGGQITPPDGLDEDRAVAVQEAVIAAAGVPITAWKAGATAPGAFETMGLSAPMIGPIFAPYVHFAVAGETAAVEIAAAHVPATEVELVFRFGRSIAPGEAPADPMAAIDALAVSLEFPGMRWTGRTDPVGPGIIADHAGNACLVVGPFVTEIDGIDFPAVEATLTIDGVGVGTATGETVMGDPRRALAHFIEQAGGRGHHIPKGMILTSGGIVGPIPVPDGALVLGEIAGLPPVSARLATTGAPS